MYPILGEGDSEIATKYWKSLKNEINLNRIKRSRKKY